MTVPAPAVKKSRRWWIIGAIVLAVAAGGGWYAYRSRTANRDPIVTAVDRIPSPNDGLPAGWDSRPWQAAAGDSVKLSDLGRAVRVGAMLVDLEVAVRAKGDQIAPVARDIVGLLSNVPAGAPIVAFLNEAAMRPQMSSDDMTFRLVRVRNAARRLLDKDFVVVGAWLEAGRLASLKGGPFPAINQNLVSRAKNNPAATEDVRSALGDLPAKASKSAGGVAGDSTYAQILGRLAH